MLRILAVVAVIAFVWMVVASVRRDNAMTERFAAQDRAFQREVAASWGLTGQPPGPTCAACVAAEGLSGHDVMLVSDGTHTHVHKNQFKGVTTSGEFTIDMGDTAYTDTGGDLTFKSGAWHGDTSGVPAGMLQTTFVTEGSIDLSPPKDGGRE